MCGRYNIDFDDEKEIDEILHQVDRKVKQKVFQDGYQMKLGEIYPTNLAPILRKSDTNIEADLSFWGFPNFKKTGVIINARSETAFEKSMFRNSLLARRCIIPSTGFYEWDKEKKKYLIRKPQTKALYMAGIYNYYEEESRFVILTTAANASMEKIHDRMPVILRPEELKTWLFDDNCAGEIMAEAMPELHLERLDRPYEQLSLF